MKIENLKTDSLIPYEWNNRKHSEEQIARIANSIQEFGFNQPIVTCDRNVVLVGHARLEAAKRLGLETVPVVRLSKLSEAQKKAYRILDNKLQNDSEWNFDNLELELSSLEEMDFDLQEWGLDIFPRSGDETTLIDDLKNEWQDMPQYNNQDCRPYRTILVHFKADSDINEFSKILEQNITEKTKFIWFPKAEITKVSNLRFTLKK